MLLVLAIVLAVLWVLGFTVFHVASGAIHLLILAAVIAAVIYSVGKMGGGGTTRTTHPTPAQ
jgi:hypothetical protein